MCSLSAGEFIPDHAAIVGEILRLHDERRGAQWPAASAATS
jgi:hypothetical protein